MGVKKILTAGVAAFLMAGSGSAVADYKLDLNNYSHKSIICATYYVVVAQCLRNRKDAESMALAGRYDDLAKQASDESYQAAKIVGLSDKAVLARTEIETQEQMADIENNCVNISVLSLKHGKSCKSFMESREEALNAIAKKMTLELGRSRP